MARGCDWARAKKIVTLERLRWAINTFEPYKAPGSDGIYPVLLQKGMRVLALPLCKLLRACLALGYVPNCWQEARVVFIPKAGRALLGTVKDFRPISLTSFILKLLERLIDRYLREVSFVESPLRKEQHAYQEGKSAETALAEVVTEVEKGMKSGYALTVLLDIEGAFNHTSVESICQGAREHEVPDTVERWLRRLLKCRRVVAEWKLHRRQVWVGKGCPQGGVISPTMWCLVVDKLLKVLSEAGFFNRAYADDVIIVISADNQGIAQDLMRSALSLGEKW